MGFLLEETRVFPATTLTNVSGARSLSVVIGRAPSPCLGLCERLIKRGCQGAVSAFSACLVHLVSGIKPVVAERCD